MEHDSRQAGALSQLAISSDRLDAAIDLLTSYDPNYHRAEDVVRSIGETILGHPRPGLYVIPCGMHQAADFDLMRFKAPQ